MSDTITIELTAGEARALVRNGNMMVMCFGDVFRRPESGVTALEAAIMKIESVMVAEGAWDR